MTHLVAVPADPYPQHDPTIGNQVQSCDLFSRVDHVTLGQQDDPGFSARVCVVAAADASATKGSRVR